MSYLSDSWLLLHDFVTGIKFHVGNSHGWLFAAVLASFTIMNSVRILAYVPQILVAARDRNGASGISHITWSLFLLSHLTTVTYAVVCLGDLVTALVFMGNALACLAIIVVTHTKRRRHAARRAPARPT